MEEKDKFNLKGMLSEKAVYDYITNLFLENWCYLNPRDEKGDKKEICDILIKYNNILILICIKNYEFKGVYDRYFRNVIDKDVRQLYGAEKKIFNSKNNLFIKRKDMLYELKKESIKQVFRIILHLGDEVNFYPFNNSTKIGDFINIFDKFSFFQILNYLDTFNDFIKYLKEREIAFKNHNVLILPGVEQKFNLNDSKQLIETFTEDFKYNVNISGNECDLLAIYLSLQGKFPNELYNNKIDYIYIDIEDEWKNFVNRDEVKNKINEDKDSYFIDNYIEKYIDLNINNQIELAEALHSFNRFERRIIGKQFYDFFFQNKQNFYLRRFFEINNIGIVFLILPNDTKIEYLNDYIQTIQNAYYFKSNYKFKAILTWFEIYNTDSCGISFINNLKPFSLDEENIIKKDIDMLELFKNTEEKLIMEFEYPVN